MSIRISEENLQKIHRKADQAKLSLTDYVTRCCLGKQITVIEGLGDDYEGKAIVGKINVDEEQELAIRYGVMSIPTVIFFKDGEEVERKVGVLPGTAFTQVLDSYL